MRIWLVVKLLFNVKLLNDTIVLMKNRPYGRTKHRLLHRNQPIRILHRKEENKEL